MGKTSLFRVPSVEEAKKNYIPLNVHSEMMRAGNPDVTQEIYKSLLECIEAPLTISQQRFEAILYIKAQIYNVFISDKVLIDSFFDRLEEQCADNFRACSMDPDHLMENKLCPEYYHRRALSYPLNPHHSVKEHYYYPIISQEILNANYPEKILTTPLLEQLQHHGLNVYPVVGKRKRFLKSDGWLRFLGPVSDIAARYALSQRQIFIESPEFPHTISRHHSPFGHALQEYLISRLLDGGHLRIPQGEEIGEITESDLLKADAWWLKKTKKNDSVTCLFDIMRERLPAKLHKLSVVSQPVFAFTSADFVNQYLMLNPFRFPCLSSFMYFIYAKGTNIYFQNAPGFSEHSPEEQLRIMNHYDWHEDLVTNYSRFMAEQGSQYRRCNVVSTDPVFFKKASKPLITSSMDDSHHYTHAKKIAGEAGIASVKKHGAKALYADLLPNRLRK